MSEVLWKVVRNCCTTGQCIYCETATPVGVPVRVEHAINVGEVWARTCALHYDTELHAIAMPMNQRDALGAVTMARVGPREWRCQQLNCGERFSDAESALQHARTCAGKERALPRVLGDPAEPREPV